MRFVVLIGVICGIIFPQAALVIRCYIPSFDDLAVLPNTAEHMIAMGQISEDGVFNGVILGPRAPDQSLSFEITPGFWPMLDPFPNAQGRVVVDKNTPFVAPVRYQQGQYYMIGNTCLTMLMRQSAPALLIERPTDWMIARIRHCQRVGVCPP